MGKGVQGVATLPLLLYANTGGEEDMGRGEERWRRLEEGQVEGRSVRCG